MTNKLKIELQYDKVIPLLVIYPKNKEALTQKTDSRDSIELTVTSLHVANLVPSIPCTIYDPWSTKQEAISQHQ